MSSYPPPVPLVSTMRDLLHRAVFIDMHVKPLGLVVHGAHGIGLEDAVFLGEIGFGESLWVWVLVVGLERGERRRWEGDGIGEMWREGVGVTCDAFASDGPQ